MDFLEMSKDDLIQLEPKDVTKSLTSEEVLHIFSAFGGFWQYDYKAAEAGRVGRHAKLKSGRCSDGFLYSKTVLSYPHLCAIMAQQMAQMVRMKLRGDGWKVRRPKYVAGIPDGATELGRNFADIVGSEVAEMRKEDGRIQLVSFLQNGDTLLLLEDFCTRGNGLLEAVTNVLKINSAIKFIPFEPVIVNRGGLQEIKYSDNICFTILPVVIHRIQDWDQSQCPLCKMGSIPIHPKNPGSNWEILVNSQK